MNAYATLDYSLKPIRAAWAALMPSLLSQAAVDRYAAQRRALGRTNSTINKELRIFRQALTWAHERAGWIKTKPRFDIPSPNAPRDRWLTRAEGAKLLDACKASHVRTFVALALYTGARKSAILELTWDRVDFEQGLVIYPLPGAAYRKKRRATVPMNETLRKELERARKIATCDWVVEHGSKPIANIKTGFYAAVRRAGLRNVTPHDLRRTFATWMVQEGVAYDVVADLLADTPEMVRAVYGHHDPRLYRSAVGKLD